MMTGGVTEAYQGQVEHEAASSAVPVDERMDSLKLVMQPRQLLDHVTFEISARKDLRAGGAGILRPLLNMRRHERPRGRLHSGAERLNVMLAEAARPLSVGRVRMRGDIPDWRQCQAVNVPDFRHGDEPAIVPVTGLQRLLVDPLRGLGVAVNQGTGEVPWRRPPFRTQAAS